MTSLLGILKEQELAWARVTLKRLQCACCGECFDGWQHWNRDIGYGICDSKFCSDGYGYHTLGHWTSDMQSRANNGKDRGN